MLMCRVVLAMVVCATMLGIGAPAQAASPADCAPLAQDRGRAAGDDPTVTPPATPTCDEAGYDLDFPEAPLATDAPAPRASQAPSGGTTIPTYALPRTDVDGEMLLLVLFALLALSGGLLIHVLVWVRLEVASHA